MHVPAAAAGLRPELLPLEATAPLPSCTLRMGVMCCRDDRARGVVYGRGAAQTAGTEPTETDYM